MHVLHMIFSTCNKIIYLHSDVGKVDKLQSKRPKEKTFSSTAYKSDLYEHASKRGLKPLYVTANMEGELRFQSKVFLGLRCFKGESATNKKEAENNAAKAALEELRTCQSGSAEECKYILNQYHEKLVDLSSTGLPIYKEATSEEGRFNVVLTVVKRWVVNLSETRLGKKEVEKALAGKAIGLLQEYKKFFQNTENKTVTMQFNEFCQTQKGVPKYKYNVVGEQASFSGSLCFYTLEQYASLSPQSSKERAETSAAMSACNDLCLI